MISPLPEVLQYSGFDQAVTCTKVEDIFSLLWSALSFQLEELLSSFLVQHVLWQGIPSTSVCLGKFLSPSSLKGVLPGHVVWVGNCRRCIFLAYVLTTYNFRVQWRWPPDTVGMDSNSLPCTIRTPVELCTGRRTMDEISELSHYLSAWLCYSTSSFLS